MVAKYSEWNRGQDEALLNKLGGMENAMKLLDSREVVVQFNPDKSAIVTETLPRFSVWKTIKVGTSLKTPDDFRGALTSAGCRIGDYANKMLGRPQFVVASVEAEVDLCSATVAELGFTDMTRYDEICARIVELGYDLCEPEDGPQLRRQYLDQPLNEWLRMAMKDPLHDMGPLSIFRVTHDKGGLWLGSDIGYPAVLFYPDHRFVFRLR